MGVAVSYFADPWFPPGDIRWLGVAVLLFVFILATYSREFRSAYRRWRNRKPIFVSANRASYEFKVSEPKVRVHEFYDYDGRRIEVDVTEARQVGKGEHAD